ncbi:gluconokinase [Rhizobium sp. SG_E_25_P2]|uniref:gluconokinase n=1 Tax=Rhizobium sp. SG_E_25_P2 TaxID=2879942 RepID=UPI002476FB62|nr:gluconokinase [Rhizobium sp. SG_E_25_P2]MDH6267420.1 gluconokinase [Rhizobium sp. SG_E_25_P2]
MTQSDASKPIAINVMGVSGCGKTTIAEALAEALDADFIEGDALHPAENVEKMSRGEPLTDDDRAGWLESIGRALDGNLAKGRSTVTTCSALKKKYRDALRDHAPELIFVFLDISRETSFERVSHRPGHFMPASLVDSQFATLEQPQAPERHVRVDGTWSVEEIVENVLQRIRTL